MVVLGVGDGRCGGLEGKGKRAADNWSSSGTSKKLSAHDDNQGSKLWF